MNKWWKEINTWENEKEGERDESCITKKYTHISRWNVVVRANSYWEQQQHSSNSSSSSSRGQLWAVGGLLGSPLVACWGANLVGKKESLGSSVVRPHVIRASTQTLVCRARPCLWPGQVLQTRKYRCTTHHVTAPRFAMHILGSFFFFHSYII